MLKQCVFFGIIESLQQPTVRHQKVAGKRFYQPCRS